MYTPPESIVITPSTLYVGTPVALLSTLNPDGTANLSAMSSAWALGNRFVLGLGATGRAVENLAREGECVINFPSSALWEHVERLAPTTGTPVVPEQKRASGFQFEPRKFERAGVHTRLLRRWSARRASPNAQSRSKPA